jgi:hypothetical protein
MQIFKVYLNNKKIDTIFFKYLSKTKEEVKKILIEKDGFNKNIKVIKQET